MLPEILLSDVEITSSFVTKCDQITAEDTPHTINLRVAQQATACHMFLFVLNPLIGNSLYLLISHHKIEIYTVQTVLHMLPHVHQVRLRLALSF